MLNIELNENNVLSKKNQKAFQTLRNTKVNEIIKENKKIKQMKTRNTKEKSVKKIKCN